MLTHTAPSPAPTTHAFAPPPDVHAALLANLANPTLSLIDIAAKHNTTLNALTLLLTRPDIQEQLAILESAAVQRIRLCAALQVPAAIGTLTHVINHFNDAAKSRTLPTDPIQRHRTTESARKAATILVRLARFQLPLPVRSESRGLGEKAHDNTRAPRHERNSDSIASPPALKSQILKSEILKSEIPLSSRTPAPAILRTEDSGPRTEDFPSPSPSLSPANIADLITRALTSAPPANRIATLNAFLDTTHAPPFTPPASSPIAAPALTLTAAPRPVITGSTAHISRTFSTERGQLHLTLKLSRRHNSLHPHCWLISSIKFHPPD